MDNENLKKRLENINKIAEKMLKGEYDEAGTFAAITFIVGESDIKQEVEKKTESKYQCSFCGRYFDELTKENHCPHCFSNDYVEFRDTL
ncbi:hypothetical protein LCGC14_0579580 [marine sediment metagenome]|uniref:Rubredoxin-like domain-containing protein n=1 Tax=marine sediment metagenome TaxID=412755 RepID=A0A0F9U2U8_9ZZZZ